MTIDSGTREQRHKSHRSRQAGASAKKKSKSFKKKVPADGDTEEDKKNHQQQNPKVQIWLFLFYFSFSLGLLVFNYVSCLQAFAFNSTMKAKRLQARATEKEQKRLHLPTIDRSTGEPAPYVIVVQGPPQVTYQFSV